MNKTGKRFICLSVLILAGIFFCSTQVIFAQKKVNVTAVGSAVTHDLTIEQTRQKAMEEAKRDALIKAGVGESIAVSDFLYTFEDNEQFKEIFQAFTSTETQGEVIINKIISDKPFINEFGNMQVDVEVEATVYIHDEEKDPTLNIKIEGIEEFYRSEEYLKFSVTPSTDGYLKIFNVTTELSSLLYPYQDKEHAYLKDDPAYKLKALQKTTFPIESSFGDGYYLEVSNPAKDKEFDLLIFVFTRENFAFLDDATDINQIMNWIYSIPMNKRKVVQVGFVINK